MAPIAWLPPLNSHQYSFIDVSIQESGTRPSLGDRRLLMTLHVYVDFYSENDDDLESEFPGFALTHSTPINVENPEALEDSLWDLILDEDLIPFPFHRCFWTEWQLHGSPTRDLPLSNQDDLVGKIFNFLRWVHKKPKNDDLISVVDLEIRKNVIVPVEEFASWISWCDEQKRIDPEFESKYSKAIVGPRDRSEVYREAESLMARRPAKIVNGELEIVVVNGGKDEDGAGGDSSVSAEESCSICLEGFSDGGLGTRLPCNHVFHENCIVRWLRGNHVCPLCRYQLPVDE
ncbi:E3 ubiquitin-protein ligase [Sesamum alatum]|uniref:RING-type E3 ubiquitin transferase n=1 Tax=Sesamum alatum TaxID=300844 RepID=A0AAE2CPI2_9LAMI|nr:E3 ubiquitin-protein ligase [Sesamum alatum]